MEIEFDFREEHSKIFGPISRPVARVILKNGEKMFAENLYVDSGADMSLLPKSVGDALGFEIEKTDEITEIKGIGERGVPIITKKMILGIGEKLVEVRVAWALIEEVPLLLGRADVFPVFDICFKKNTRTTFTD